MVPHLQQGPCRHGSIVFQHLRSTQVGAPMSDASRRGPGLFYVGTMPGAGSLQLISTLSRRSCTLLQALPGYLIAPLRDVGPRDHSSISISVFTITFHFSSEENPWMVDALVRGVRNNSISLDCIARNKALARRGRSTTLSSR